MAIHFSEQPILTDFDRFLTYLIERPALQLTNDKALLKGPDLLALNERMTSFQTSLVTNKNTQMAFTLLNTFFLIGQAAELFLVKTNAKNSKNELFVRENKIREYDAMTDDEKYFTLFETFWCRIDWGNAFDCRSFDSREFYLDICKKKVGQKITLSDRDLKRKGEMESPSYYFAAEMFAALGFLELTWDDKLDKRPSKYYFPYKDLTVKPLGKTMLPILVKERPHYIWHLSEGLGIGSWLSNDEDEENEENEDETNDKFEDAFLPHFEGLTIEKCLFSDETEFVGGCYYFKVILDKKVYRSIKIAANDTFNDLHNAIQKAFDFDNDHLYAFFMDGRRWSQGGLSYWSPNSDDGIPADEVQIGGARLFEGKNFLYLFDFGDEWCFKVMVETINTEEKEPKEAQIIESVGENPEQYHGWDDDDE